MGSCGSKEAADRQTPPANLADKPQPQQQPPQQPDAAPAAAQPAIVPAAAKPVAADSDVLPQGLPRKARQASRSTAAPESTVPAAAVAAPGLHVITREDSQSIANVAPAATPSAVNFHASGVKSPMSQQSVTAAAAQPTPRGSDSIDLTGVQIGLSPEPATPSGSVSPAATSGGVRYPQEDRSEKLFDVPTLDANTLMRFACERLQVCYSSAAQLNTPALQERRQEPETVALESLRKLRFRSDGLQENARKDLVPAMVEVLRALTMENTKIHLLELRGLPADSDLMRALSVVIRANKALGVLHLHLAKDGTSKKSAAKISAEICQSLQFNRRLVTLDMSGTQLGASEGAALADLINYNTSLQTLNLARTSLGAAGGHIAAMIQLNTSILAIDLSGNDFGDAGGRAIAHALSANATLAKLDLGENNLTATTVADLAKFLVSNRTLRELSLRENDLGVQGGRSLPELLRTNRTLTSVNLNGCSLGLLGCKWFAKALESNHALTSLGLAYNDIGLDGALSICTAIRANTVLVHLDLTGNNLTARASKVIKSLLQVNNAIQTLTIAHNDFKPKHEEIIGEMLDANCAHRSSVQFTPRTLLFPVDFGRTVDLKTHLILRNTATVQPGQQTKDAKPLCFHLATNVPGHHILFPSMGFIQPGASVAVRIRLRGRFLKEYCRHALTLRTMPVEPEVSKGSAAGLWSERSGQSSKASTFVLRCDWSLSGSGGQEWTPQAQETIDAHISQADQKQRAFGHTAGPSLVLSVPTATTIAAEGLKADREKLLGEIQSLRARLQTHAAKETEQSIQLVELQKKEAKLQVELAKARAKAESRQAAKKGHHHHGGSFDVSELFLDGDDDDEDLMFLGLGGGRGGRRQRRRRRRDEDLLDLLGESSASGSDGDLFNDDDEDDDEDAAGAKKGARKGRAGRGGSVDGGGGGGGATAGGSGGNGPAGESKPTLPPAAPGALPAPAAIPSFAPTRKPVLPIKKPGGGGGGGAGGGSDDDDDDDAKKSSSDDDEPEEKKEFKPDADVVSGGGAPMAPPMAPPILGGGAPPAPPMGVPMAPGMGPPQAPGMGPALPAKAAFKPGVEMRKLHWSTVSAGDVTGTLWGEVDDSDVLGDGDFSAFEQAFGAAAPSAVAIGGGGGGGSGRGTGRGGGKKSVVDDDKVTFVDPKRSFNLDITLSRFRITYDQIRESLLACDESVLTEERVDALLKFAPLPEETKALKHFQGDPTKLGKAEQYLRIVSTIPRLTERLELLLFKLQYPDLTSGIEKALEFVDRARLQIKESTHLRAVLKIVLAFGNYMNSGTRNGQAYGFQLETLTKLRSAKSADGTSNLLNFLVQHIQRKSPEVAAFVSDLSSVKVACRIESAHVSRQVQRVSKHLKQLQKELRKAEELEAAGNTPPGDRFLLVMREFYSVAHTKAKSLEQRQVRLEKECLDLATFFGAKHLTKYEDLFQIFDDFLADYQSAERFIEAVKIRDEAKTRREAAAAAAATGTQATKSARGRTQSEGGASSSLSLAAEMVKRRSAMGGAGLPTPTAAQPATIPEDNAGGIDLSGDSDWDSD